MSIEVRHDAAGRRFVAVVDGHTSYLSYEPVDDTTLDYRSTFVPEPLRGRGIATVLVEHALEYAKDHHLKVIPTCPFVAHVIQGNPSFGGLVLH